ncbi:MAG: pyruvate, phosphate dikinase [Burkholderiales bacterium]|nr:MAG: pyruvate, phosphate dikinase [Burkholderiales bacterium]
MSRHSHGPKQFFLVCAGQGEMPKGASRETMGGKAYNLLEMAHLGLNVPPALVIGTQYTADPASSLLPLNQWGLPALEAATGLTLGDERRPLVVSVRSGAPVSMPGMLETLLNIGLCDRTVGGVLRQTGNPRMVWDAYRRLIATYGEVVAGVPHAAFEQALREVAGDREERLLDFSEHRTLVRRYLDIYLSESGGDFPQDPLEQMNAAVLAVFRSWTLPKAVAYRRLNGLSEDMGTAVTIQRMVFGNTGSHSGAGVGFSRNPMTGEPGLWVDYLVNAQGEDVVGGHRNARGHDSMVRSAPLAHEALKQAADLLERHFGDMQDLEFTVQDGELFMLQTRSGKRTPQAAARIALDLAHEGLIDPAQALERIERISPDSLVIVRLAGADGIEPTPLAHGEPASGGIACGEIALDAERVAVCVEAGRPALLVRSEALTEDIGALQAADGLLTRHGARTSHAAVVARQLGKVCLVGCDSLEVDLSRREIRLGEQTLPEGEWLTLDGTQGVVFAGRLATVSEPDQALLDRIEALRQTIPSAMKAARKKARM